MTDEKIISNCDINQGPLENVIIIYYDHEYTGEELFRYFPDEVQYSPQDFIGLTKAEAIKFIKDKQIEYLRRGVKNCDF